MNSITPQQLDERLQAGSSLHLLDVRTPAEFSAVHVPGVQNVPLDRLDGAKLSAITGFGKAEPIYIFCRGGGRAKLAAGTLAKSGYGQCCVVEGGTDAWTAAGLPVERGTQAVISLERQVRIAAGLIVLTGVFLAQGVHPAFIWLSGFVGAGLVFAGLSDWCGMGLLLARMPWNQGPATGRREAGSDGQMRSTP